MKFNPRWANTALFVFALNASPVSNASLVDIGGGLIHDVDLNIYWLADANLAASNAFGVSGINQGLKRLDKNRLALALEVAVPPLAFLGLMWVMAVSLSLALYAFYGHSGPLGILAGTAAAFAMAVLMSWMRFAGVKQTLAALAAVPGYFMWKLPMYSDFFTRRETRWMKTARDSVHGAQHGIRAPFPG